MTTLLVDAAITVCLLQDIYISYKCNCIEFTFFLNFSTVGLVVYKAMVMITDGQIVV